MRANCSFSGDHELLDDEVLEESELTGHTRSGQAFALESTKTYNMPLTQVDQIYKIPEKLQWLVMDSNNNFCWVYFSKGQQRFKCHSKHPNSPGKFKLASLH